MLTITEARKIVSEAIVDMDENVAFTVEGAYVCEDADGAYISVDAIIGECDALFRV